LISEQGIVHPQLVCYSCEDEMRVTAFSIIT
jgi:hypothetical protein